MSDYDLLTVPGAPEFGALGARLVLKKGTPGMAAIQAALARGDLVTAAANVEPSGRGSLGEGPWSWLPIELDGGITDTIAASTSELHTVDVEKNFIIYGFVGDQRNADYMAIDSIKVSGNELFAAEGSVPMTNFSANARTNQLPRREAVQGLSIKMKIRNLATAAKPWYGAFYGYEKTTGR